MTQAQRPKQVVKHCPQCHRNYPDGVRFCGLDGVPLVERTLTEPLADIPEPSGESSYLGLLIDGRYRVNRLIGRGGMGTVYEVDHVHMQKKLAMKLLHEDMVVRKQLISRFTREARAVSRLSNEHTVRVYDFGRHKAVFFLVMEYLDGEDLEMILSREGALPWRRALRIMDQICRSLEEAHQAGIIHRDLKPENIMILRKPVGADYVKVLDFGLAKITENADDVFSIHSHRDLFGTPFYMSPEQIRSEDVDGRADVYALGCLLYRLLTNQHVFDAPYAFDVLRQHLTAAIPSVCRANPQGEVPVRVDRVVWRALAKRPGNRFPDVSALQREIVDCLDKPTGEALVVPGVRVRDVITPIDEELEARLQAFEQNHQAAEARMYGDIEPPELPPVSGPREATKTIPERPGRHFRALPVGIVVEDEDEDEPSEVDAGPMVSRAAARGAAGAPGDGGAAGARPRTAAAEIQGQPAGSRREPPPARAPAGPKASAPTAQGGGVEANDPFGVTSQIRVQAGRAAQTAEAGAPRAAQPSAPAASPGFAWEIATGAGAPDTDRDGDRDANDFDDGTPYERTLRRSRRVRQFMLAAALVVVVAAVGLGAQRLFPSDATSTPSREVEPNNTAAEATLMTAGQAISGQIGKRLSVFESDRDFYTLDLGGRGKTLELALTDIGNLDLYIDVLAPSGRPLTRADYSGLGQPETLHRFRVASKRVFLQVSEAKAGDAEPTENISDSYTLTATVRDSPEDGGEIEPNDIPAAANAYRPGKRIPGYLDGPKDVDYYRISTDQVMDLRRWEIAIETEGGLVPRIALSRVIGDEPVLVFSDEGTEGLLQTVYEEPFFPNPVYLLGVSHSGRGARRGSYQLVADLLPARPRIAHERDDERATATQVSIGEEVHGLLEGTGDVDVFAIPVTDPTHREIEIRIDGAVRERVHLSLSDINKARTREWPTRTRRKRSRALPQPGAAAKPIRFQGDGEVYYLTVRPRRRRARDVSYSFRVLRRLKGYSDAVGGPSD